MESFMRKALEQLKLMINSYDLDDDDIIYFCEKVISEIRKERWEKEPQPMKASSILDAAYMPLAINDGYFLPTTADEPGYNADAMDDAIDDTAIHEDFVFPRTVEGRGTKVTKLPEAVGEIADLIYFSKPRKGRSNGIPASYLNFGNDTEGTKQPLTDSTLGEIDE